MKPNIYEYERTKCGSIDLVRAHLCRYRTHIQHARAIEYSYLSAVVPPSSAAALLSPAAPPLTDVKPNIYEYERTKCGSIDLVRAHLSRYRTYIQHTRAIEYSYMSAVVPPSSAAALLSPARRRSQLPTQTPAARIPACPGRPLVRADLVPPEHRQHACLRAAIYRQTSLADRHIQDTAAHDLVPLLLAA